MMKKLFPNAKTIAAIALPVLLAVGYVSPASGASSHESYRDNEKIRPGGSYNCKYTKTPITIDGRLNDPAWEKANLLSLYIPVTDVEPISKTETRLMWDDNYLYVGFKAYDKDVWSHLTERDTQTCTEDVLEVFLQTNPAEEPYFNFEINALGTIYDAYNLKRRAGGDDHHRWRRWNIEGIKTAIHVEGEINNPDGIDKYWQMEVAIPFAELATLKGKTPQPGDKWHFQVSRYDYSIYLPNGVELTASTKLTRVDFHLVEEWQPLVFNK